MQILSFHFSFSGHLSQSLHPDVFLSTLDSSGQVIPAHRVVLAAVSAKLGKLCDPGGRVVIRNIQFWVLQKIVTLIYKGKISLEGREEVEDFRDGLDMLKVEGEVMQESENDQDSCLTERVLKLGVLSNSIGDGIQIYDDNESVLQSVRPKVNRIKICEVHQSQTSKVSKSKALLSDLLKGSVVAILNSSCIKERIVRIRETTVKADGLKVLYDQFQPKFCNESDGLEKSKYLDFGFWCYEDALEFLKQAKANLAKFSNGFDSIAIIQEDILGHQFAPVLTESDLLQIQCPSICKNIFRSAASIVVRGTDSGSVEYHFKSVADINKFLHCHAKGFKGERYLGSVKKMKNSRTLISDRDTGRFRLLSRDTNTISRLGDNFASRNKFSVISRPDRMEQILEFEEKLELFRFLVGKIGSMFDHLQFDESLIVTE